MSYAMASATKPLIDHKPQTEEGYDAITTEGEEPTRDHRVLSQPDTQPLIDPKNQKQEGYGAIARDGEDPEGKHRDLSQPRALPASYDVQEALGPENYMGYAILSAIFCCFPLGIPAVYYAFKTSQHSKKMDWRKARQTALRTRQLVQMAVSIGVALWCLGVVVFIAFTKPGK